jgi:hypothetical protein
VLREGNKRAFGRERTCLAQRLRWKQAFCMKRAEVQLPDTIYQQVEGLAAQLHLTVPELLCKAAEQMVHQVKPRPQPNGEWRFPEGHHLGTFRAPVEDWRLLANEVDLENS